MAQNAAEQAKVSSQKEADIVIKHANDSAKKILDKAHTDVVSITQEYDRLKQEFVKFRAKFRNFITVQMETFEDLEKDFIKNYNLNQTSDFDKIKSQESRENNDFELNSEVSENFEKDSFVDVQPFESDDKTSSRFKSSEEVDSDLENIKKFFVSET